MASNSFEHTIVLSDDEEENHEQTVSSSAAVPAPIANNNTRRKPELIDLCGSPKVEKKCTKKPLVRKSETPEQPRCIGVRCPVCLQTYDEITKKNSKDMFLSTLCGHVFCSTCLKESLKISMTCPTCRKKLKHNSFHPLFFS